MIKAYLTWISTQYEGEDIEIRYRIYEDEELLCKESIFMGYRKPAVLGQVAIIKLLKELERYMDKEIVIIINDGSLYDVLMGTSATKKKDIKEMAIETRKEINKFENIVIENVSGDHVEMAKWNEILKP